MRYLSFWMTLILVGLLVCPGGSIMDIDYSHDIKGTGTLITDYRMDDSQSSQATGRIRGTGDIMNRYLFTSRNDSENITIQDQFVFSKIAALDTTPLLIDYPKRSAGPANFRLVGPPWAQDIKVTEKNASETGPAQPGAFRNYLSSYVNLSLEKGNERMEPSALALTPAVGLNLVNFKDSLSPKKSIEFDYNSSLLKNNNVSGVTLKMKIL